MIQKPTLLLRTLVCLLAAAVPARAWAAGSPIDSILLDAQLGGGAVGYDPILGLEVIGVPETYRLHDGTSWFAGAGTTASYFATKGAVSITGSQISYALTLPADSLVYSRTDYDNGLNSSNGQLRSTGPLTLFATSGSRTAVLSGYARIAVDEPANYTDDRFHYFDAPLNSLVPFSVSYTLAAGSGTWSATTLDNPFTYTPAGTLDFTQAIPEPASGLTLAGVAAAWLGGRPKRRRCSAPLS